MAKNNEAGTSIRPRSDRRPGAVQREDDPAARPRPEAGGSCPGPSEASPPLTRPPSDEDGVTETANFDPFHPDYKTVFFLIENVLFKNVQVYLSIFKT